MNSPPSTNSSRPASSATVPSVTVPSPLSPNVQGGIFISDLHLFSPRSDADTIPDQLAHVQGADRCIVLGGDIFDFRWSIQGSHSRTLDAAVKWLEKLLTDSGQAHVRFVPGNHDCHPEFLELLDQLAASNHRFGWHEHHFQIGDALFLHGDVLDARGSLSRYRAKFHHEHPQTDLKHRMYDVVVEMRLHKLVPLLRHRPQLTCRRLRQLIESLPSASSTPYERVFFGHTHAPMFGYSSQNVRYYNPGAALKHMQAFPQEFEFAAPMPLLQEDSVLPAVRTPA